MFSARGRSSAGQSGGSGGDQACQQDIAARSADGEKSVFVHHVHPCALNILVAITTVESACAVAFGEERARSARNPTAVMACEEQDASIRAANLFYGSICHTMPRCRAGTPRSWSCRRDGAEIATTLVSCANRRSCGGRYKQNLSVRMRIRFSKREAADQEQVIARTDRDKIRQCGPDIEESTHRRLEAYILTYTACDYQAKDLLAFVL